uniref:ATP synthase complex subunit 8 n=1 Tax=Bostrichoidea sp. 2 KM-2017 TaxID=2219276 RepID=A0A346RJL5_9COLE|nr:ATP synthase F0 subunit 8 [Bostrichoidea sp. 2 KM-2017]
MPQMAPMNWLTLFISFSMFFIAINSINYYNQQISKSPIETKTSEKTTTNWKW